MALSPRKVVPLASGDDWNTRRMNLSSSNITKRVFFCGVVVEGSDSGRQLREDVQDLVVSLGFPLSSSAANYHSTSFHAERPAVDRPVQRMRAMTDFSALADVTSELLSTERSYFKRLQTLKFDYADPLRKFARSKNTAILAPYEAKILFGNIDSLLPINEAFLADLEKLVSPNGAKTVGGIGDVALKHFKILRGFENYKQYYVKREEAQDIFEGEMSKKSSGFAAFVDRIKYSSTDTRNRVGLRELLINPVQRIPQYTLLFRTMIKHMAPGDPQRAKLVEAEEIASRIALAETDEQTKRAATMYCLSASVDGFPPALISNSRRFIDCVDVEDVLVDAPMPSTTSGSGTSTPSLHCTLFLFDDKLMIVKRPGNGEKSGRSLAGLSELDKLTKAGGLPLGMKKSGMVCKGVVDITDVVATDVGGADIHLYLENPPQDQGDRWSSRPFRPLTVERPPFPANLDPTETEAEKRRFLENLWNVQATFRAKAGQSVVLCAEDKEVESKAGKITIARTYFNVYQRTAFLQEKKKTKIVVHIDASGSADPIPFGINASPFVVVRVQPMAGELSRCTVTSSDPNDESEEDIVQTARVPSRIVQTIHQFGLFNFRTGSDSLPSTPTANTRSRTAIFGLDAISRNLFNARPSSTKGDIFGGSVNGHKRSKSITSRSSMYTQTTSAGDDSLTKFSRRSNSTATAATSISMVDDDSYCATRATSKSRKLLKRGKSPGGSESGFERNSPSRCSTRSQSTPPSRSASQSREREAGSSDGEKTRGSEFHKMYMDPSEWDLTMRLELARQNSSQHGKQVSKIAFEQSTEETIYEEGPPSPVRPTSRASRDAPVHHSTARRPESVIPNVSNSPPGHSRSASQQSSERRPVGPRSPSPLPSKTSHMHPSIAEIPSVIPSTLETSISHVMHEIPQPRTTQSPLPRSKRQPFLPTGNTETTPKAPPGGTPAPCSVEPLSIKKKVSVRSSGPGTPTPARKTYTRNSPSSRNPTRIISPRRVSPQVRSTRDIATKIDIAERLMQLVQSTKGDVESSRRAVKRIKLEIDGTWSGVSQNNDDDRRGPSSPDKASRGEPMTKAAQERMLEMRQLIKQRKSECPQDRPHSVVVSSSRSRVSDTVRADDFLRSLEELFSDADQELARAITNHDILQTDLRQLTYDFKERWEDLEKTRVELQNTKRQCELVKSLLADATAEKDIMYEAFNEELDGMYNDANLPESEAWTSMTMDLRRTKEARNALTKANSELTRQLAEVEMQKEEWGVRLRAHGLLP